MAKCSLVEAIRPSRIARNDTAPWTVDYPFESMINTKWSCTRPGDSANCPIDWAFASGEMTAMDSAEHGPVLDCTFVDVFAESPLSGNQLAVVRGAGRLDTATMQAIALETNFSETTFVIEEHPDEARVRIFTPNRELPFAGHPTLGTAWVLGRHRDAYALELAAGRVGCDLRGRRRLDAATARRAGGCAESEFGRGVARTVSGRHRQPLSLSIRDDRAMVRVDWGQEARRLAARFGPDRCVR